MSSPFAIDWHSFHKDFPVTLGIILINVSLFVLGKLGLIPSLVSIPEVLNLGTFGAHFFHFDLWHIGSNLLILLLVGKILEPLLRWKLILLTISIWILTILILWYCNNVPVIGFSGIGMGLLTFAMCVCRRNPYWYSLLWPMVVINILFGLMPGISWWGHLGGAIAGLITFGIYKVLNR